jgi:amino acid transporter
MTAVAPDAGTLFTWGAKSIGPRVGWLGAWGLVLSSVLAGVGAAEILANSALSLLGMGESSKLAHLVIAAGFILLTTWLVARGAEESSRTTLILTVIQYGGLALFAGLMAVKVFSGQGNPDAEAFSWQWFNPLAIHSWSSFVGGFLVALFVFWGFDASLAMSEESEGTSVQAGRTGVTAILITLAIYVLFTVAALSFAGIDPDSPSSLTFEDNIDDVFNVLATDSIGAAGAAVAAVIVGLSAFSATMSTVMPTARGLLAMATYRALPSRFADVSEATQSPRYATWFLGGMTLAIYAALSVFSEAIVEDSVYSVGISICAYYTIAALSCVFYFYRTAFSSLRLALEQVILPLIGAVILVYVMFAEGHKMMDPEYGSGGSVAGVGTVFVVGVVTLLLGAPLMALWNLRDPAYFQGKTLPPERAHWVKVIDDVE